MDKFINNAVNINRKIEYSAENDKIRTNDKKNSKSNEQEIDKKENKNWNHECAMDKTDDRKYSFLNKHGSEKSNGSIGKNKKELSNNKLCNMNELETHQINKNIEKINTTKYDIYNNTVVHKNFSLLRNGLVKFNRKRNILLSEELKKK